MRILIFATAVFVSAIPALADAYLQPGPGWGSVRYREDLQDVFKTAYQPDVRLREIVEPSFWAEYAVGIREAGKGSYIFALKPSQQVWGKIANGMDDRRDRIEHGWDGKPRTPEDAAQMRAQLPIMPAGLNVAECQIPIAPQTATRLIALWNRMIDLARPSGNLGLDGELLFRGRGGRSGTHGVGMEPRPKNHSRSAGDHRRTHEQSLLGPRPEHFGPA